MAIAAACGGGGRDSTMTAQAFVDGRCADVSEEQIAPLLAPAMVEKVEPADDQVLVNRKTQQWAARPGGARLSIRPAPGLTREWLARALECHAARVTAGRIAIAPDDPYGLPSRPVTIEVTSSADGFAVLVRSDSMDDAKAILDRAQRLAAEH
jgi:hypothetical protein